MLVSVISLILCCLTVLILLDVQEDIKAALDSRYFEKRIQNRHALMKIFKGTSPRRPPARKYRKDQGEVQKRPFADVTGEYGSQARETKSKMGNYSAYMGLHVGDHDVAIAIKKNGRVQCVFELERWFDSRYTGGAPAKGSCAESDDGRTYCCQTDSSFCDNMEIALQTLKERCDIDDGVFPDHFDSVMGTAGLPDDVVSIIQKMFRVSSWSVPNHVWSHAYFGFKASPFRTPLVFVADGSPDTPFVVFHGGQGALQFVDSKYHEFAIWYSQVQGFEEMAREIKIKSSGDALGHAGKFMGYAGVGKPTLALESLADGDLSLHMEGDWSHCFSVENHYAHAKSLRLPADMGVDDIKFQRALAASIHSVWQKKVSCVVEGYLELVGRKNVDGIVLTGGASLNVVLNQYIHDSTKLSVYVPPAPGDDGLAVGALLMHEASTEIPNSVPWQYLGFRLWDAETLSDAAREWGAQQLSSLGGVEYLADLLAGGGAWLQERKNNDSRPIIAIVRGRQEYGPRALGHRSLVTLPDSEVSRDRLNRLKYRAWWRPAAPMIADEAIEEVFGRVVKSPYMTMAPRVRNEIKEKFPAIAHFDGTARHQSVGHADEPWVHALLMAVGRRTGLAALINTSFNRKGKPIVNTVRESLVMLSEERDLDYVLIEDFLFPKKV